MAVEAVGEHADGDAGAIQTERAARHIGVHDLVALRGHLADVSRVEGLAREPQRCQPLQGRDRGDGQARRDQAAGDGRVAGPEGNELPLELGRIARGDGVNRHPVR